MVFLCYFRESSTETPNLAPHTSALVSEQKANALSHYRLRCGKRVKKHAKTPDAHSGQTSGKYSLNSGSGHVLESARGLVQVHPRRDYPPRVVGRNPGFPR